MTITVDIAEGGKDFQFVVEFAVVPRVGEVIWVRNEDAIKIFKTRAFIVTGVYYFFSDKNDAAYLEVEVFKT